MNALILAGGQGTRLRPLTLYTPKPVVPVMNRPFLAYQIEVLSRARVNEITLSLSHQPAKIKSVVGDGSDFGVRIRYITEPTPLGTGGAFRFAADDLGDTIVVLNGDILTNLDVSAMIQQHRDTGAEATIGLCSVKDPSRYGLVETNADGSVRRFLEKPSPEIAASLNVNTINAGIYVLEPSILDLIPKGHNRSFEYDVFPAILDSERNFRSFLLRDRYWRDIGSPSSYLAAHQDFLSGRIDGFQVDRSGRSEVASSARLDRTSVLGDGCVVRPGSGLKNSVLGPGVYVGERAIIENAVIWANTRISASAEVRGSVLGRSCQIGRHAIVGVGTVLGDEAIIPDYSSI